MLFWGGNGDCTHNVVHVGIFVRQDWMVNAARSGTPVREQKIWTSSGSEEICDDAVRWVPWSLPFEPLETLTNGGIGSGKRLGGDDSFLYSINHCCLVPLSCVCQFYGCFTFHSEMIFLVFVIADIYFPPHVPLFMQNTLFEPTRKDPRLTD